MMPDSQQKHPVKWEWTRHQYRREEFEICRLFYQPPGAAAPYSTDELDELNHRQAMNLYRVRHHIPFPDEIRAIRTQYGLSAARMSEVLDFGINSYRQYEEGEMPTPSNAKLIRLAKEPATFQAFVQEKRQLFSANAWQGLQQRLAKLQYSNQQDPFWSGYLWGNAAEAGPLNGFVAPNFEKAAQYVLFFISRLQPLKTKLNKLLFYADFLHFKRHCFGISGWSYRAIQLGPVPAHYSEWFGVLESQGYLGVEHELHERGVGERFLPAKAFNPDVFSPSELAVMEEVVECFAQRRSTEVVEISHNEPAWLDNHARRALINYQPYAFSLKHL